LVRDYAIIGNRLTRGGPKRYDTQGPSNILFQCQPEDASSNVTAPTNPIAAPAPPEPATLLGASLRRGDVSRTQNLIDLENSLLLNHKQGIGGCDRSLLLAGGQFGLSG
jgi:hypothetical protein